MEWKRKLSSRKFWLSVAAFLSSVGGSIAGIVTDNQALAALGMVCAILAGGIYAACEAAVDSAKKEE